MQAMLPMHDGVADLLVEWGECLTVTLSHPCCWQRVRNA